MSHIFTNNFRWNQQHVLSTSHNHCQSIELLSSATLYGGIAAVRIRAEVMAQADDIILYSGKSELFVKIKLTEKDVTGA